MKTLIKGILLILLIVSCQNDDINSLNYSYYQFSNQEKNVIISYNYQVGDVLTYKNQSNELLHFKVIEASGGKLNQLSRGTMSGGGGILEAYFDFKVVRLEIVENGMNYSCCDQINYVFSKRGNVFRGGLKFPLWNKFSATFISEVQNPVDITFNSSVKNSIQTMTINNIEFSKVVMFSSNINDTYNNSTNLDIYVNEIYYDLDFGIIQFNDTLGNQWKFVN